MEISSEFEFDTFSPERMFRLTSANVRDIHLEVNFPAEGKDDPIFFRIASGNLVVDISDEFSAEMERITKKRPPNNTTIQMIFTGIGDEAANTLGVREEATGQIVPIDVDDDVLKPERRRDAQKAAGVQDRLQREPLVQEAEQVFTLQAGGDHVLLIHRFRLLHVVSEP